MSGPTCTDVSKKKKTIIPLLVLPLMTRRETNHIVRE